MMESVLDDLRPEPGPKMWPKFDIECIVHKEFVPPGQMVNGKFYCDGLGRLWGNIRRKRPDEWSNNSWALDNDNVPAHASLLVQEFLGSAKMTVIPHRPYSPDLVPFDFPPPVLEDEFEAQWATF